MKWLAAVCVSVITMLAGTVAAAASTYADPYTSNWTGYDAASGQCGTAPPTSQVNFAVLNVTSGRPFQPASCLGQEVTAAGNRQVSLYFNTGYSGAYGHNITADCSGLTGGLAGKFAQQAYQIGCSEASYAIGQAGSVAPAMWWLDVETSNSWSSSNTSYNADTIQGAIDEVHNRAHLNAGVYSTPSSWSTILGSSTVVGLDAGWAYAGNGFQCTPGATAFGAPLWLLQGGTVSGYDSDTAC